MNKISITVLLISVSLIGVAQKTETKYYKDKNFRNEVSQEKAKFSRTVISDENGTVTTFTKDIKADVINWSETLREEEPFGIWIYQRYNGPAELNYDFELVYLEMPCTSDGELKGVANYFLDNKEMAYVSPKIATGEGSVYKFISDRIVYPARARRQGIEGTVHTSFTITREGIIEDIIVTKGVYIHLDKEAVRIIRELKFSNPPTVAGQPEAICVNLPITFRLG